MQRSGSKCARRGRVREGITLGGLVSSGVNEELNNDGL